MDHRPSCVVLLAALAGCSVGPTPSPAELARFEAPARDRCDVARADDFDGAGEAALQRYAYTLTRTRGSAVGLKPGDVALAISDAPPKPGPQGVIAGEIACAGPGGNGGPYRITLYRQALEGRQLYTAYHTVAHEFAHIEQMERDRLPCAGSDEAQVDRYEREAIGHADALQPACERPANAGAASAGR
jgi:hypothetical protein